MLIATDLDGTLVPNDSTDISPRTAAALRDADAAGVPVVFVTGRPLRWMESFWSHVGTHGMAIVSNGAVTFDVATETVRRVQGIDADVGLRICELVARVERSATFAIECLDGIRRDERFVDTYGSPAGSPRGSLSELWTEPAVKLLIRCLDTSDPVGFRERVTEAVRPLATPTWSMSGLVEVSAPGVHKASALARLCRDLGVDRSDVIAFGDMPNDIPMLSWAGRSYAMADADPLVSEVATGMAPPCEEDGVAQVLERLLLETRRGG